jgi:hypothetical protein
MSYSFQIKATTKALAIAEVATELAGIVNSKPEHGVDQVPVQAAADAFINLLPDDATQDVDVIVVGSVHSVGKQLAGVLCQINASLSPRPAKPTAGST